LLYLVAFLACLKRQNKRNVQQGNAERDFYANRYSLQMVSVMKGHSGALQQPAAFRRDEMTERERFCSPPTPAQIPQCATRTVFRGR
jgi:hypothetical protein